MPKLETYEKTFKDTLKDNLSSFVSRLPVIITLLVIISFLAILFTLPTKLPDVKIFEGAVLVFMCLIIGVCVAFFVALDRFMETVSVLLKLMSSIRNSLSSNTRELSQLQHSIANNITANKDLEKATNALQEKQENH